MESKQQHDFPLDIVDVEPQLAEQMKKLYCGEHTGFVRVGPKGYFYPHKYRQEASRIYNMPLRSDDVFVASYPRSGTTWTQELVWLVVNDLDYATSHKVPLVERYPYLEYSIFVHPVMKQRFQSENSESERKLKLLELVTQSGTDFLESMTSQRFIKTHLPMSLLPPELLDTCKLVYVARDPRDVVVSMFHLERVLRTQGFLGNFHTYWKNFLNDLNYNSPYFESVREAWEKRHHPNMLFLFYEELSKDLPATVRRVATFFKKQFSLEQVAKLCDHLSIHNFKNNKSVNYDVMKELGILVSGEQAFIRKGKTGGWREYFDEAMQREAEEWITHNLRDTDLRFPSMQEQ